MKCMGVWAASDAFGRDARSEHWWLHERRGQGGANRHEHCGETCCSDESGVHESTCVRTFAFALEYRVGRWLYERVGSVCVRTVVPSMHESSPCPKIMRFPSAFLFVITCDFL